MDLFTGRAEFYKAGAAPTFLVKNGRAGYVQSDSLPAGILEGAAFEKSSLTLREGDRLVLVSDGVTATGADWVKSQLEAGAELSAQQLAEDPCQDAGSVSSPDGRRHHRPGGGSVPGGLSRTPLTIEENTGFSLRKARCFLYALLNFYGIILKNQPRRR